MAWFTAVVMPLPRDGASVTPISRSRVTPQPEPMCYASEDFYRFVTHCDVDDAGIEDSIAAWRRLFAT